MKSMADFKKWYICLLVLKYIKSNFANECMKYSCPVTLKKCINITEPLKKHESSIGTYIILMAYIDSILILFSHSLSKNSRKIGKSTQWIFFHVTFTKAIWISIFYNKSHI